MHANKYSGQTNTPKSTLIMLGDMRTGKGNATAIISDMQVADVWDHRGNCSRSQVGRASGVIGVQRLKLRYLVLSVMAYLTPSSIALTRRSVSGRIS